MLPTLFLILASLAVLAAFGVVLGRNLVHSALFLVAFFFLIACVFLLLEAEFLASVQVLVYIGAVAILMMFGIMLTRNIEGGDSLGSSLIAKIPAALICLGFLTLLIGGIGRHQPWVSARSRPSIAANDTPKARAINDMGRALGQELMGRYALPFEVAGLLLTAVLVGSIALARQDPESAGAEPAATGKKERRTTIPRTKERRPTSRVP